MDDNEDLERKLEELRVEHQDMDIIIQKISETSPIDFLRLQRMKKRKLSIKDSIARIESMLVPDIIA